jgi:flagellar biosynthetic protein FliP
MTTVTISGDAARRTERHNLVRHFFEMVLAMLVGMAILGPVAMLICTGLGHSGFLSDHAGVRAAVMATNMTIGMAVWMRHRGHGWGAIAEMGSAMFVPLAVLIGPYWAGLLSGDALVAAMHVLMLPAMAIAMLYRRDEYAQDHRAHRGTSPARSSA